jgi:hypothetical protein
LPLFYNTTPFCIQKTRQSIPEFWDFPSNTVFRKRKRPCELSKSLKSLNCLTLFTGTHAVTFAGFLLSVSGVSTVSTNDSEINCQNRTLPPRTRFWVLRLFGPGIRIPSSRNCIPSPVTVKRSGSVIERGNGAPNFRLFNVTASGSLTLQNLTLRNANANGSNGGAIQNAGNLTLEDVTLTNNTARFGGVYSSGTLTITQPRFPIHQAQPYCRRGNRHWSE